METDLSSGRCAALLTDLQAVFASADGPFGNTQAGPTIEAVNRLLEGCRERGVPVIHSRYVLRDDLGDAGLLAGMEAVQQGHLSESSPLVATDPRVSVQGGDVDTTHNRPSAFYDSELDSTLASLGADRIVLAGLSVNNAISATARDAFARDIPVVVVREATGAAPFEPADELDAYFRALDTWTAEVAPLEDVLAGLPGR